MGERDERGRFAKGNQAARGGNGGRPSRPKEQEYLDIMLRVCTPDEWEKVCTSALTHAKAGDAKAREWLGNYIIGKPVERHEVTGADGQPIEVAVKGYAGISPDDWPAEP